jgi:hypothetical protein
MDDARLAEIAAAFQARTGASGDLAGFGEILAAAVADERSGVAGCLGSVRTWASDPARFDAEWIAAVDETIESA